MNNNVNVKNNSGKLINWITVWAFIFGCIAFNLYLDNQRSRSDETYYRTQYEAESQRADSLHRAAIQLEQRLQEIETAPMKKISTGQTGPSPKSAVARES